jgi:hypothetical protein
MLSRRGHTVYITLSTISVVSAFCRPRVHLNIFGCGPGSKEAKIEKGMDHSEQLTQYVFSMKQHCNGRAELTKDVRRVHMVA